MDPIVFENIRKTYDGKVALEQINLSILRDQTTAVIGPSGSGKSTLLQLINGLVVPDRGKVYVYGDEIDYDNLAKLRRRIGYAVQGTGLFPHMTVKKNITLLASLEDWDKEAINRRMRDLMDLVDLPSSYTDRYPHELSGGEQQRVGLCRAMILNPKIFLLDEAFGALDALTRSEIHQEFLKLQKMEARTIVLVTHDLREAIKLADQIVILNEGNIEQVGSRTDIMENPETEFVERFVHMQLEEEPVEFQK
ncbi:ATP-binding cassette domain-containing protein [candidate division KSB1 bacterium]|nr:ATP-binding cassette domain-containing protein [candidate division KSB1 bacterium]NIR69175.1 ATP-binding cassette domain-containing protein [candidate division KSB1 bacterium]NIS25686.1 ATP-binding cassette domain-containing protein [candidate division KSB1 bacterium]NIT72554.1 ATP-binding cassette domain-containing protein [candidate division KSB1 bacterium]NIU26363.1 ATP-binding cassette domain-containing protein [candidate division KSB1 bacterium]